MLFNGFGSLGISFQRKILIFYIAVIILPFSAAFAFVTHKTSNEIKGGHISHMIQLNDQINNSINMVLSDIDRFTFVNILNTDIEQILSKPYQSSNAEYVKDNFYIGNIIRYSTSLNSFVLGITMIGKNGRVYTNIRTTEEAEEQIKGFVSNARLEPDKSYITPVYDGIVALNTRKVVSVVRILLRSSKMDEIGFICVDMDFNCIREMLDRDSGNDQLNALFICQGEKMIYKPKLKQWEIDDDMQNEITGEINRKWRSTNYNVFDFEYGGGKYLMVGTENPKTGWKIVQCLPLASIQRNISDSIRFYILTLAFVLLVTILIGYLLSVQMAKPISKLSTTMKKIEQEGQLNTIEGEEGRKDEIGQLINSFNRMAIRLQESINKEYVSKVNQKKIEVKMLQAQINPHFLYNTLSLISAIADIEGVDKICSISNSLSDMFRYNIKENSIVKVRDEMEQIKNYICIQQFRFIDMFKVEFDIEEGVCDCLILKFLLQPLVENAIYHGLEQKGEDGLLRIEAKLKDDRLYICIEDNGVGMDEEQVRQLGQKLEERDENFVIQDGIDNLGVMNVHYRIHDYYGSQYGLFFFSKLNIGTTVRLIIPAIKEEGVEG